MQKIVKENSSKLHNMILSQKDTQAKTQTKRKPQMQNKTPIILKKIKLSAFLDNPLFHDLYITSITLKIWFLIAYIDKKLWGQLNKVIKN